MSYDQAAQAAAFIKSRVSTSIDTAIVLGSGLGAFADQIESAVRIRYEDIPGFVPSTVEGHAGQLVIGDVDGQTIIVQQGRFHYYEGYDMQTVMLPVRSFGLLGVKNLILTNAAGSLDLDMRPGSLMLITDHLNCMGVNPLRGPNDPRFGARFPDMTEVYDRDIQALIRGEAAAIAAERHDAGHDKKLSTFLRRGVYCALSGPTYETPAEIHMYRMLGADAVGMSTVPEAIAARQMDMRVAAISCITNLAAGMSGDVIDHQEVIDTGARVSEIFQQLIRRVVARLGQGETHRGI